ncbi:MAG: hypothetical protein SGPRY_002101, partial [Prymnesium sp.]
AASTSLLLVLRRSCRNGTANAYAGDLSPQSGGYEQPSRVWCALDHMSYGGWLYQTFPSLRRPWRVASVREPVSRALSLLHNEQARFISTASRGAAPLRAMDSFVTSGGSKDLGPSRHDMPTVQAIRRAFRGVHAKLRVRWCGCGAALESEVGWVVEQSTASPQHHPIASESLSSVESVMNHYDAVVVVERLVESFLALLHLNERLSIPLCHLVMVRANGTPPSPQTASEKARSDQIRHPAIMASFLRLNQNDVALYKAANRKLDERIRQISPVRYSISYELSDTRGCITRTQDENSESSGAQA